MDHKKPPLGSILNNVKYLRQNMTDAEKCLWNHLRDRRFEDLKFRRQHPIPPYVADFFCEDLNLIIELDGGQHAPEIDQERTNFLEEKGYKLIRFWNNDVLANIEGVLTMIKEQVTSQASSHPDPFPGGEGAKKAKRLQIGEITTAHGVRGLVKVRCFNDDPETLESYAPLYTSPDGNETIALSLKHQAGGALIAEIDGVSDRDQAEKLRGTGLWVDRAALPDIVEEGQYYHVDLIGLTVVDKDDNPIGKIIAVENFGAGDMFEIRPLSGPTFYLPFIDEYVLSIDIAGGVAVADIPEGLR
jgi:16S rRNA processing protein RimM